jgi:hypothetical protein
MPAVQGFEPNTIDYGAIKKLHWQLFDDVYKVSILQNEIQCRSKYNMTQRLLR